MRYENLHTLLEQSSGTRSYFLTLPVELQLALHEQNDLIHTAQELHLHADAARDYQKHVLLSEALPGGKHAGK